MKNYEIFCLKNRMLFYNIFTNLIGVWIILILSFRSISPPFYEIADFAHRVNMVFIPIFLTFIILVQFLYEKPIRMYLNAMDSDEKEDRTVKNNARRRLLNAPFFIVGYDLLVWIFAAVVYSFLYSNFASIELAAHRVFFQNALVGLIASTGAFFVLEQIVQRKMAPVFFPEGGLCMVPKTARIRISTRMTAYIIAVNFIPFIALLILVQGTYATSLSPSALLAHMRSSVVTSSLISISVGICMTILLIYNFRSPLRGVISVLKRVREGSLDAKVKVTTNDEIGYAGDVVNEMTEGLKERERMKHSLALAQGVQLNLLPNRSPQIDGLDIHGVSIYCDETGGDYYDYLTLKDPESLKVGVLVGDVSDHGVHAALLMTTARALIRLRASTPSDIGEIVSDVNSHLSRDTENGGQFMTLFFLVVDIKKQALSWVRAGHEPGIIYYPDSGRVEEMMGQGIPLGVDGDYRFVVNEKSGLAAGQVIVLGTDGIWDARNAEGEVFGKNRFYDLIRRYADLDAEPMIGQILAEIRRFQRGYKIEDDITLVVIKVKDNT